ncbi:MAG TPA: HAD-IIA family hydrolase, partial [Aggregatilineales bacterium]|nr:HAD-IIA family hydrolase [Aggregatilineales bacterium]
LFLREHGIPYLLATNNSSKNVEEYVARLRGIGVPVEDRNIVTSGAVTVEALGREYPFGTPIYVIGSESLTQLLTGHGFRLDESEPRAVVIGLDRTLTYEKLRIATRAILRGAQFIGTNADHSLPTPDGPAPGAGSIIAALQVATGVAPRLMGKPEPVMFQVALERLGTTSPQTLMIGDRLETDILGGHRAGLKTALVLSGISSRADVDTAEARPDGVFDNLAALWQAWQGARSTAKGKGIHGRGAEGAAT